MLRTVRSIVRSGGANRGEVGRVDLSDRKQQAGLPRRRWRCGKETCIGRGPHAGNAPVVVSKFINNVKPVGHAIIPGPIRVYGDTFGIRGAGGGTPASDGPAGPAVHEFVEIESRIGVTAIAERTGHYEVLKITGLKAKAFGGKRTSRTPYAAIGQKSIAIRVCGRRRCSGIRHRTGAGRVALSIEDNSQVGRRAVGKYKWKILVRYGAVLLEIAQ